MRASTSPRPSPAVARRSPYRVPRKATPVDLHLDANEGLAPPADLLKEILAERVETPDLARRYPDTRALQEILAARMGVSPERLIVTAGGDDALERACRSVLWPGREMILPLPGFEMLGRFAENAGGEVVQVPWPSGPFPTDEVLARVGPRTGAICVVTPNNPTGAVATREDLERLAAGAPEALILLDHAYVEFGDADLTARALELPNVVVFRTLSKAWGMAGLRVGYAAGPAEVIGWMRAVGLPFPVSQLSVEVALRCVGAGDAAIAPFVAEVRRERAALTELLEAHGGTTLPSQGNFVLVHHPAAAWLRDGLAGLGIGVRAFPDKPGLEDALRISCPGEAASFDRLRHAIAAAMAPEALLFDMDGVLADVSASYRQAILATAASYGVTLAPADVAEAKSAGAANNDWVLTRRLLAARGVEAPLDEVTDRFETAYQGTEAEPGLRRHEALLVERVFLERLASRCTLGIVTGRPRGDAERFLREKGVADLFPVVVCMEDAPGKPDPAPVRLAMERLGVARAWMVGDTPDDIRSARAAGAVPVGIVAPGDLTAPGAMALEAAGAGRVLDTLTDLEQLLEEVRS